MQGPQREKEKGEKKRKLILPQGESVWIAGVSFFTTFLSPNQQCHNSTEGTTLCSSCPSADNFAENRFVYITSCRRAATKICPRPGLQVVNDIRHVRTTHMDRSPLLYVHVGLPVQPTKAA